MQTAYKTLTDVNADTSILYVVLSISSLILDTLNFTMILGLDGCSVLADGMNSKETPC